MEKLIFAQKLVYEAADFIRESMKSSLDIETKANPHDFVTNVDKQTERLIVDGINAAYDNQDFITEEKVVATQGRDDVWIIDPIDGTTNFIFQKRNFAISLAYYEKGQPIFGIVYDVMGDEMVVGVEGGQVLVNGERLPMLNQKLELKDAIVNADNITFKTFKDDLDQHIMVQRYIGSAALEIVAVACGRSNAYMSRRLKPWDVAAAVIILKAVGGRWQFGDVQDGIFFEDKHGYFMSASNTVILNQLQSHK